MCNAAEYSVAHGTSIKPRSEGIEELSDALEKVKGCVVEWERRESVRNFKKYHN